VEEPHGEALDLQRFSAAAIDGDLAGTGKHCAGGIDPAVIDTPHNGAKLVQRSLEDLGSGLRHGCSLICRGSNRLAALRFVCRETLVLFMLSPPKLVSNEPRRFCCATGVVVSCQTNQSGTFEDMKTRHFDRIGNGG